MKSTETQPCSLAPRLFGFFLLALFVLSGVCQEPLQSSRADTQPPADGGNERDWAAALKRLSTVGDQNAETDLSAIKAYSALGLAGKEEPREKIDDFYARQAIPIDEEVRRSLGADLLCREVEECRRGGKSNADCLKETLGKIKERGGASDILNRLVASIEKSPLEMLRASKPLERSAHPEWPEIKPERGPTGGVGGGPANLNEPTFLMLKGHTKSIEDAAFTPDGRLLATVSDDKTVRIWDAQTGALLKAMEGYSRGSLGSVAFSADGKTGASDKAYNSVIVWDVETGAIKYTLTTSSGQMAFSPDGNTLATMCGTEGCDIALWDLGTGSLKQTLQAFVRPTDRAFNDELRDLIFSADGNTLAGGGGVVDRLGEIVLFDARTGTLKKTLTDPPSHVEYIAISPDGNTLASWGFDRTVRLWDLQTGQIKHTFKGIFPIEFSPDGKTLADGGSLWDTQTGALKHTLDLTKAPVAVHAIQFLPDGKTMLVAGPGKGKGNTLLESNEGVLWRVAVN